MSMRLLAELPQIQAWCADGNLALPSSIVGMARVVKYTINGLSADLEERDAEIERLRAACSPREADTSRLRMGWRQEGSTSPPLECAAPSDGYRVAPGALGVWRFEHGTWIRWVVPVGAR